ncbi:hypothetical protein [Microbacterium sp. GXF0217]
MFGGTTMTLILPPIIIASDAVTPGIAVGVGTIVAAFLVLSAFVPRARRGASAA